MPTPARLLPAVALACFCTSPFAATVTYTNPATFLGQLAAGAYTETFSSVSASDSFGGGGFAYTLSAPGNLYYSGSFAGSNQPYATVTISFTGTPVRAVGGNFFATLFDDSFFPAPITVTLGGGSPVTFTPTSASAGSFIGFTSDSAITSLSFSAANVPFESLYAAVDNLTVGVVAVPEPPAALMAALGLAALAWARRRKA